MQLSSSPIDEGGPNTGGYRVVVQGEIDLRTAAQLEASLGALIDQGASLIILDTAGVEFLDSSGLRVIVSCGTRMTAAGGRLLIEGMSGAVQRVLEISGLIDSFRAERNLPVSHLQKVVWSGCRGSSTGGGST